MKVLTAKLMTLLGLLVIGATAAYGSQTDEPKMNGKLRVGVLSPEKTFYTGKPYNKDLGAYLFNYRNYDPQIARWTTPDPSGFPDGANNRTYAPVPTSQLDYQGLFALQGTTTANPKTVQNSDKSHTLTVENITGVGGVSDLELSILRDPVNGFGGWTFNTSSSGLPGTMNVGNYYASNTDRDGNPNPAIKIDFDFTYQDKMGAHLRWIQFGTKTTDNGQIGPFIDNGGGNQPFYGNVSNSFSDLSTLQGWTIHATWDADTFAVIWDGKTTVTIYDGINWNKWVE